MKKDVIQCSDKDQDPSNENPAIDIHSNDFPVYEDRGHQIPTNQVPDCVNDQEKPDEVSEELNEADPVDASRILKQCSCQWWLLSGKSSQYPFQCFSW